MCDHNNCETVIYLLEVIILSKPHTGPCLAIAQLGRLLGTLPLFQYTSMGRESRYLPEYV